MRPRPWLFFFGGVFLISIALSNAAHGSASTVFGPSEFQIGPYHFHFSHQQFNLQQPDDGVLTISKLTPHLIINGGFIILNRKVVLLRDFLTNDQLNMEQPVALRRTNFIAVFLRGSPGAAISVTISRPGAIEPNIISFTAEPSAIFKNQTSTLTWETENVDDCFISPDIGNVTPNSSVAVTPLQTTTFVLTANGQGLSTSSTLTVTVENRVPEATPKEVTAIEDASIAIRLSGIDPDNDPLTFQIVEEPKNGTLEGVPPDLIYTPRLDYHGPDSFTFAADDGSAVSKPATISITISSVNDIPRAGDDSTETLEDQMVTIDTVLANDSDADGDELNVIDYSQPSHGQVTQSGPGAFEYVPFLNFNGIDTFTYTVSDSHGGSDQASVSVDVLPENDPPVANAGPDQHVFVGYQVQLDGSTSSDVDGDPLTYQWALTETPDESAALISEPSSPAPAFNVDVPGTYRAQLIVSDGMVESPGDEVIVSTEIAANQITQFIATQSGGTIRHPDGATLIIPAGALAQDAGVSIDRVGYSGIDPQDGMLPLTYAFSIDLGGAAVVTPIELRLKLPEAIQSDDTSLAPVVSLRAAIPLITENLLLKTRKPDGTAWLRTIEVDSATREAVYYIGEEINLYDLPLGPAFEIDQVPDVEILVPPNILSVPFYYQSGHPWCVPTSLAMLINFHDTELGLLSNWTIAARSSQDSQDYAWPDLSLINAGMESGEFESAIWDADLIPANPFADFIRLQTQGYHLPGLYGGGILAMDLNGTWVIVPVPAQYQPPRPINILADVVRHAFLGVGANSHSIWIQDPNGDIAKEEPWDVFRENVINLMETNELSTIVINAPVRPETERRGSIVLSRPKGLMLKDHRYNPSVNTLYFEWDGNPYEYGYYWYSEQDTFLDSFLFEHSLTLSEEGYLPAYLEHDPHIANVTTELRQYILDIDIVDHTGTEINSRSIPVTVPAYSWHAIGSSAWGQMDLDTVTQPGVYQIVLSLYHEGVLQDTKTAQFEVVQHDYPNVIASAVPVSGNVPLSVQFTATGSSGLAPYYYYWNTGDGMALHDVQSPFYTYETPGEYTAEVTMIDNYGDISRSQVVITAYPEAQPVLVVKPIYIDFGKVLPGTGASKTIHIKNEGELPLEINTIIYSDISYSGNSAFEVGIPSCPLTIAPGEERIVTVDFLPDAAGYSSGLIGITSNDPDNQNVVIGLVGQAHDLLSILSVSPETFIFDSDTTEQMLTIGNDGSIQLSWTIADNLPEWLSASSMEGLVFSGSPNEITVSADPTGLPEGVYTHNLQVASSGGDAVVLVVLEVEAEPPPVPVVSFTAPYYSHGHIIAKRGYVSQQGVATPGPYGESSESSADGVHITSMAHGFRGWCYPGELGCQCDFPAPFNFPGDHPVSMDGPACNIDYDHWMASWAGVHADPVRGEISTLAGAVNKGGPTQNHCVDFNGTQICYPPPSQWGDAETYGYIRRVYQVVGEPGLPSGSAVAIQADFTVEGDMVEAIALLTRAEEVTWLESDEYLSWNIALEAGLSGADYSRKSIIENDVISMESIITNVDIGSNDAIYRVGDVVVFEVLFKERVTLANPGTTDETAYIWSNTAPSQLLTDSNSATIEQVETIVKENGSRITSSLDIMTQGGVLIPFSNTP